MSLSYTQQHVLNNLKKEGPGWHRCDSASPTVEALERRGLVQVRRTPYVLTGSEKSWRVLEPSDPEAPFPEAPMMDVASLVGKAWVATGWNGYRPGHGWPEPHLRKLAAQHLRAAADLLDP